MTPPDLFEKFVKIGAFIFALIGLIMIIWPKFEEIKESKFTEIITAKPIEKIISEDKKTPRIVYNSEKENDKNITSNILENDISNSNIEKKESLHKKFEEEKITNKSEEINIAKNIEVANNDKLLELGFLERKIIAMIVVASKTENGENILNKFTDNIGKLNLLYHLKLHQFSENTSLLKNGNGRYSYCGAKVKYILDNEDKITILNNNTNLPLGLFYSILTMNEGAAKVIKLENNVHSIKLSKILASDNDDLLKQTIIYYGKGEAILCGGMAKVEYKLSNIDGSEIEGKNRKIISKINLNDITLPTSIINIAAGKPIGTMTEIIIKLNKHNIKYYKLEEIPNIKIGTHIIVSGTLLSMDE